MVTQGYHDNTECNYIVAFVSKHDSGKISKLAKEEIQKLACHKCSEQKYSQNYMYMYQDRVEVFGSEGQKARV